MHSVLLFNCILRLFLLVVGQPYTNHYIYLYLWLCVVPEVEQNIQGVKLDFFKFIIYNFKNVR